MTRQQSLRRQRALAVIEILQQAYPDAACGLTFKTPWQLMAATILSAQCTDTRVNQVTPHLFATYSHPAAMAQARQGDVERLIRSTGFYRNKAKSLIGSAQKILKDHGGQVPHTMPELTALPGVGRKTANVILGNAFGVAGMVVDTHVGRIAKRLGWTASANPESIEKDLCKLLPADLWTQTSHLLIFHGRRRCRALTALCSDCQIEDLCPKVGVTRRR
ncbi:MAG: endonuclease III [Deltaproteobacteria bacterium]|jgi:endonuclease-3|nr:endonuclease III [Deltaproteobacteria bacterium]